MHRREVPALRFRDDGSFRILQIADTQEGPNVSKDTLRFLDAALAHSKPDLAVLTGDQLKGYSPLYHTPGGKLKIGPTLRAILGPLAKHRVPFAVTFGNHDGQAGLSVRQQMYYYLQFPNCVNSMELPADPGTLHLPLWGTSGKPVFVLYLLDTGADRYSPLHSRRIAWYRRTRDQLAAQNGGQPLPALAFQHIPVPEFYEFVHEVPSGTRGCIKGYGSRKGHYYLLDGAKVYGGRMGEAPCAPARNSGELAALTEAGDVLGLYVGHDHRNSFSGRLHGIDAGYCPCCGFNTYGPGPDRAVRLFTLHEDAPRQYESKLLSYRDLLGDKVGDPVRDLILDMLPATPEEALPLLLKLSSAAAAGAYLLRGKKR